MDREPLNFWKNWLKEYRVVWALAGGIFIFSLLFLWYSWYRGPEGVMHWEKLQEQKVVETTVHSFHLGPFELSVPGESYVIFEYLDGSDIVPNTTASYLFLIILIAAAVLIVSVITTIERFWFFIGMALFIAFIAGLRLEVLGLFGRYDKIPVAVVLFLYVAPAFFFNRIKTTIAFVYRLIFFTSLTAILALVIVLFSTVQFPFYHLTLTGYTPGIIVTVLFIIIVAHEVFASLVYISNQGTTKSLRHFSIISAIYMINLVITGMHELGIVQWKFLYINLYLLLTVSAVLGVWGFRKRESLYANILPFHPFGGYFFLALGAMAFATTAQLLGNANDPALKVIRDFIIFSHLGYGLIFFIYVFSNFVLMLARNMAVYKVLYQPTRMPYFTYRFAGMITMLAFVFYSNWHEYVFHGTGGFYNSAGDLYTLMDNPTVALSLYDQGRAQAFQNNRSNYALGRLKVTSYDFEGAHLNYTYANAKRPTPFSLANAGNAYVREGKPESAIVEYQHGLHVLPGNGALENNLGYVYAKLHRLDSSVFYLERARGHRLSRASAETNFFALAATEHVPVKTDSVLKLFDATAPAVVSNALALSTAQMQEFKTEVDPLATKQLNLYSATLLNNYIIKYATSVDTVFINEAYRIASDSLNSDFSEALKSSLAFAYYHRGNVSKALEILAEQVYVSQQYQGKFNYIMGLWALEQQNPDLANSYFTYADTYEYKEARFYSAIALTEARRIPEALMAWDTVSRDRDVTRQAIAVQIKKILTMPLQDVLKGSDAEKYQYCRYRIGLRDSTDFNRIANTFDNANYKAQALLDLSRRYFEADRLAPAINLFNRIAGLELTDKNLYNDVRHFELLMLAHRKEARMLARQINKDITFDDSQSLEKFLYTAVVAESNADSVTAEKQYALLATYNPYFEEGILAAADFYRAQDMNGFRAYTILAEALQINGNSIRLLKAYAAEAARKGFDLYAASAAQRLGEQEQALR
ncbi:hypothetical protein [Chryseolinea soli]|uniref:Uncharacterized protein n=1 Tax=Chryseolinea soli TaxID=2321403 RepID=A0A385SLJ3_9BACT|nr:hypothetical protein [Chryseolinea soli]AYB29888.1 hypothetical protein D4L85_04530 [Chryseolinea soli]